MTAEETLAHLERGARIAFDELEHRSIPLTDDERAWYATERKRLDYVEVELIYYAPDGAVANRAPINLLPRKEAEQKRDALLAIWAEEGRLVSSDGSRWAVEIREATE
jgi:hypothetical protein